MVRGRIESGRRRRRRIATLATALVARWCVGSQVETTGGVFQVREGRARAAGWGGAAQDALRGAFRQAVSHVKSGGRSATTSPPSMSSRAVKVGSGESLVDIDRFGTCKIGERVPFT